jgi:hypothetical protein
VKNTTLFRETGLETRAELFNVTTTPAFEHRASVLVRRTREH